MTELLTSAQMRAIEAAAIDAGLVTGVALMERAGEAVLDAVLNEWPELAQGPQRALVLCGPGNNGGDGFVVARLLRDRGWSVAVHLWGAAPNLPPDARANHDRWDKTNPVHLLEGDVWGDTPPFDLVVDALLGIGLTRPFTALSDVQMAVNTWQALGRKGRGPRVVAIDVPSGLDADRGTYRGVGAGHLADHCMTANLTVTFHAPKIGHYLGDGPACCGKLVVRDIGLLHTPVSLLVPNIPAGDFPPLQAELMGRPACDVLNKPQGHKFSHGHALVVSGGMGHSGAARLAARGALRVGAGLVTVAAPGSAMMECAAHLTAIMLTRCDGGRALSTLLEDVRITALCLGPGLGLDDRAAQLVHAALTVSARCMVLDADALTLIAAQSDLFGQLHSGCVLTPHGGEFARLFPDIADRLKTDNRVSKLDATREAAARAGCTVLFKGADTVIATPDGRCVVHAAAYDRAAPWLATAGAGDVLAGIITGLLARRVPPLIAARTAAWLHTQAALGFGPGLSAEDLPDQLPKVMRDLGVT